MFTHSSLITIFIIVTKNSKFKKFIEDYDH